MENNPNIPQSNNGSNSPSYAKYIIIGAIILVAVYVLLNMNKTPQTEEEIKQDVVSEQLSKFQQQLNELPADATEEAKYQYYLRLARAEYQLNNYEGALQWLNQFPEEGKNYQGVYYTYAQVYQAMGNMEQARENAKLSTEAESDNPQRWQLYAELSMDQEASVVEAIYKEGLEKTENDSELQASYDAWKASQAQ